MKKTLAQLLLAFLKSRQILTLVPLCIVLHIYSVMSLIHSKHLWEITDPYILSGYFLSYEKGFIPRGLIGTVYSFITKFISGNMFFALLFAGTILFYLFCFYLLLFRIRQTEDRNISVCFSFPDNTLLSGTGTEKNTSRMFYIIAFKHTT